VYLKSGRRPLEKKSVHKTLSLKFLFLVCLNSPCRRRASCPCVSGGEGVNSKSYSLCTFPCRIQQDEILTVSPTTPIPVAGVFYAAFCSISPNFPVCPFRISCVSWFRRRIGLWKKFSKFKFLAPSWNWCFHTAREVKWACGSLILFITIGMCPEYIVASDFLASAH
jgi:hypothetical protein